ncbi:hypothetical protein GobsT_69900 [Gemmata obscuriglobus]|uniref:Cytochrome c domain-containing protein n=1 Tax=Gemmata obscuriglobus TaxID=114 RepID=A0A2Z3H858_9BACT|nr:hypothetical protein [Gemmata obscuriglobus]AWM41888.1 hypothetical protein C1280_36115 [Gemmata obscuriglobus]QEG32138.1 hypothetical protein GobsT_69900 [Gemmata obscuriglobus]VTS11491.1 signal peptide protein : Uncharacterized protein OS=Singulisphaera acidiphila (strain ATCC BAA-1392 / DSM 18658 / VKM B-2454 / MOB10) GN=Sinac_6622 PE=4 SV=1 [Gemmata obscuriglobus UQM 2246]
MLRLTLALVTACAAAAPVAAQIDAIERPPISYKTAQAENVLTALQKRINAGQAKLKFADDHGYLPSLLKELNVSPASQVLVFSKTSFQRERITPKTPRALYFNDDVYVGFCLRGDVLEFSAVDTKLGTAFYTLDQEPAADGKPEFLRQRDNCLSCHASNATGGAPGHLVRSVFTERNGMPVLSAGTFRTDHSSPFSERWGGWYVTGTHGKQTHMGNWTVENKKNPTEEGNAGGQNVTELKGRFTVANYLTPHSDIVALLVFEHQAEAHNRIARALVGTRQAHHYEETLNKDLGEPTGHRWDSAKRRIESLGDQLAKYLLFSGEAKLEGPVAGTSDFAKEFAARGPFDKRGRTLRAFDLNARLFKYPCSYLVYSQGFQALPKEVKDHTLKRMYEALTGADTSAAFAHLSADDRKAVLEILRDTLPDLPNYWKK